jgi:hypothetical protein
MLETVLADRAQNKPAIASNKTLRNQIDVMRKE